MSLRIALVSIGGLLLLAQSEALAGSGRLAVGAPVVIAQTSETPQPEAGAAPEAAPTLATVHVTVEGVRVGSGTVWVALCDTGLSIEGCPTQKSAPASTDPLELTFENVTPGVYAIAGYEDLNGNNVFDKIMGVPREPYALSGAAGDMLVPTFDAASLQISAGDNAVTIRLKRLGE